MDIISQHPKFQNLSMRKYGVDGIETIGAWGDEPFEIKFRNNTSNRVQVKISVDGTDVLSGDPATTSPDSQMWLVNAYGTLQLKAWPESRNGGAAFVFTSATNSVALHTHGDMSSRGIIAAAVFEEGYVEPVRINPDYGRNERDNYRRRIGEKYNLDSHSGRNTKCSAQGSTWGATKSCDSITYDGRGLCDCDDNLSETVNYADVNGLDHTLSRSVELKSLAAVGAGSYVNQNISYAKGLIKPVFADIVKVRYLWWDDLKAKLEDSGYANDHQEGFPGDVPKKMINLKGTPRIDTPKPRRRGVFKRAQQEVISRF